MVAAPGLPADLADRLARELTKRLSELYPGVQWHVPNVVDGLVTPPASAMDLIDACHQRLLAEDWELALCLTDLPIRIGRRTVAGHASPTHRVALISLPALGAARVSHRAIDTAVGMLNVLLGESAGLAAADGSAARLSARLRRRLVDLSELADEDPESGPTGLAALVRGGRLRLLGGMVRANRPWRLVARLYRALVAAVATAAFALVESDVWRISVSLDPLRLGAIMVLSIAITAMSLIAVHRLWEHGGRGRAEDQVLLFNAATAATVGLGVLSLYVGIAVLALAGAALLITPDNFGQAIGSGADFTDYLKLAWLMSSLATVGGALGAGLESDVAIREAAYAYRPERDASWSAWGATGEVDPSSSQASMD